MELALAYLQKKMMKKVLREDAGADVLCGIPCSAHISGWLMISPRRISHRFLSLLTLVGAHEGALESV